MKIIQLKIILDKMMYNYLPVAVQAVSKPPSIPSIEGFPARKVNMASSMGEGDGGFGPPPVPGYLVWLLIFLA